MMNLGRDAEHDIHGVLGENTRHSAFRIHGVFAENAKHSALTHWLLVMVALVLTTQPPRLRANAAVPATTPHARLIMCSTPLTIGARHWAPCGLSVETGSRGRPWR